MNTLARRQAGVLGRRSWRLVRAKAQTEYGVTRPMSTNKAAVLGDGQARRPWQREGADQPPAAQPPVLATQKGKLLTTPTRLLKFVLPLPLPPRSRDDDMGDKDTGDTRDAADPKIPMQLEPLALLVHPQQPLSYVERLIQAELAGGTADESGRERVPDISFRAENTGEKPGHTRSDDDGDGRYGDDDDGAHIAWYSGLGHEAAERRDADKEWVRWSSSTEMGDFLREAARGREFSIEIAGMGSGPAVEVRVSVPSFNDRTHYQRLRLWRLARAVERLAAVKRECDALAHRGARRLAKGGFAALAGWWAVVYYTTYQTPYGWSAVEPVTYLAGLGVIMGGYLWFLFISRDLSYRAAMNVTVLRRQTALYEARGFDVRRWDRLVEEVNGLRAEIRRAAAEYDIEWDEESDLGGGKVKEVLEKEERRGKKKKEKEGEDEDEEEVKGDDEEKKEKGEEKEKK